MKKKFPKPTTPKPDNDKSYTGRQKRVIKTKDTSESSDKSFSTSSKKTERPKSSSLSEEGFRKVKRKRISSSDKTGPKDLKKKSDTDRPKRFLNKPFAKPSVESEASEGKFSKRFPTKKSFKPRGKEEDKEETKGSKRKYRPSSTHHSVHPRQEKKETPTYKFLAEKKSPRISDQSNSNEIRLNRYIANAGICSRREADQLIADGLIKVNNKVVTEMGFKVKPGDEVKYENKVLKREKFVYVLLNKPKDFITTTDDPEERKTVMDLVKNACDERIYPVGRLDRNTTGLLLLTNDGELAEKLSHPSHNVKKVYQVEIDKPITDEDFEKIKEGVDLEDGKAYVDDLAIITPDAQVLGIEIHLGRNRIVRRIFESLGYTVLRLDRVTYAGLTKKDLPRGNWRFLTEKEVIQLKHFS
jgi:23S rRNA pseudouridine2605 synthase